MDFNSSTHSYIQRIPIALSLRFTAISEFTLSYISLTIGLITLFIGGIIAGVKGKENGWIVGA